jgi:adenylate kinase
VSELNLILLGAPGAGKGTQAGRLREDFRLPYFATGDMLRAARAAGSELGQRAASYMEQGELVPDEVVIGLIVERVDSEEARDGFLLDGFPRNVRQAEALEVELERVGRRLTAVLYIEVPDDEVVRRISGRRVCSRDPNHIYHVDFDPPAQEGVCDQDGAPLLQREDDHPDAVRRRLEVYHEQTTPLVEYYEQRGLLHAFDGTRSPTEVHDHIRATLATLRLEERL